MIPKCRRLYRYIFSHGIILKMEYKKQHISTVPKCTFGYGLFPQRLPFGFFFFFFLFWREVRFSFPMGLMYCSQDSQASFFTQTLIKNGFYSTIHTFKNYFATIFLIFNFSKNKLYPNGPLDNIKCIFVWTKKLIKKLSYTQRR